MSKNSSSVASKVSSDANGGTHKKSSLVVCFGEMLIDFVPTVGGVSLSEAPAFKKAPGGAPANVAVGISRLGGLSAFIGKVMKKILFSLSPSLVKNVSQSLLSYVAKKILPKYKGWLCLNV